MKVSLEYNEKQGFFHYNYGQQQKNTFGWKSVCDFVEEEFADNFVQYILRRYPSMCFFYNGIKKPKSFLTIKRHFNKFKQMNIMNR